MKVPYINTNAGITVILRGRPYHAAAQDSIYDDVVEAVENEEDEHAILAIFERAATRLKAVTGLTPDMLYSGGVIKFRGEVLHNYAADRLVTLIEQNRDHKPLARFLDKLQANPSKRVVDNLYSFLEHGNIPLTDDGDFLAYKAVREDYKDIHSGTFDNSIGRVCSMARNKVDENPDRTCSSGLHVCSFDYLPHFSHADGHVMICKINPADVVAIPADYHDTKMRVSRYQVVGEVFGYYQEHRDVLGDVGRTKGVSGMFRIVGENDDFDDPYGTFFTLEEAKHQARKYADDSGDTVEIIDDEDMVVWSVGPDGFEY